MITIKNKNEKRGFRINLHFESELNNEEKNELLLQITELYNSYFNEDFIGSYVKHIEPMEKYISLQMNYVDNNIDIIDIMDDDVDFIDDLIHIIYTFSGKKIDNYGFNN